MRLLCLSNGHGEDEIAVRILKELQQQPSLDLAALPLVGEGHAYTALDIPKIGSVKAMPSGGFLYMDSRQLVRDLRGGLLQLTLNQGQAIRTWVRQGSKAESLILAVGDILPLLFAWRSGVPYAFVGTAKSEYHLRDEGGLLPKLSWAERLTDRWGGIYLPWERWLMRRDRCRAVFPRDTLTSQRLQTFQIPAFDLGNPMMDGLEREGESTRREEYLTFLLLPGSRAPEAYNNWQILLQAVAELVDTYSSRPLRFLAAIVPSLALDPLTTALQRSGWYPGLTATSAEPNLPRFTRGQAELWLTHHSFADCLHRADIALAMAGTATEQFVGLGKPAITMVGPGPQFNRTFARSQAHLLGPSVVLLEKPSQVTKVVQALLGDPDRLQLIAHNGSLRMGPPGAARRIADRLLQLVP